MKHQKKLSIQKKLKEINSNKEKRKKKKERIIRRKLKGNIIFTPIMYKQDKIYWKINKK